MLKVVPETVEAPSALQTPSGLCKSDGGEGEKRRGKIQERQPRKSRGSAGYGKLNLALLLLGVCAELRWHSCGAIFPSKIAKALGMPNSPFQGPFAHAAQSRLVSTVPLRDARGQCVANDERKLQFSRLELNLTRRTAATRAGCSWCCDTCPGARHCPVGAACTSPDARHCPVSARPGGRHCAMGTACARPDARHCPGARHCPAGAACARPDACHCPVGAACNEWTWGRDRTMRGAACASAAIGRACG